MSEGDPTHLRRRALSMAASTFLGGVACVLLVLSSRTASLEQFRPNVIDVVITLNPERADPERPQQRQPQCANAPASTSTQPNAPVSADQQRLSSMLACLRPRGRRPAHCPEEPAPNYDDPRTQLPVGGDFYQPPTLDLDRIHAGRTQCDRYAELRARRAAFYGWRRRKRVRAVRRDAAPAEPLRRTNLRRRQYGRAMRDAAVSRRGCGAPWLELSVHARRDGVVCLTNDASRRDCAVAACAKLLAALESVGHSIAPAQPHSASSWRTVSSDKRGRHCAIIRETPVVPSGKP